VVDRFGHSHYRYAHASKIPRDRECTVATDHDQRVQSQFLHVPATYLEIVIRYMGVALLRVVKWLPPSPGSQNRSAAGQDPRNRLDRQRDGSFRPDESIEPVGD